MLGTPLQPTALGISFLVQTTKFCVPSFRVLPVTTRSQQPDLFHRNIFIELHLHSRQCHYSGSSVDLELAAETTVYATRFATSGNLQSVIRSAFQTQHAPASAISDSSRAQHRSHHFSYTLNPADLQSSQRPGHRQESGCHGYPPWRRGDYPSCKESRLD